jgi:hypothetical protein
MFERSLGNRGTGHLHHGIAGDAAARGDANEGKQNGA